MHIESLNPASMALDKELLVRLKDLCGSGSVNTGLSLRVGVSCAHGCICQIVHTNSMVEAIRLFEILRSMGYHPDDHHHQDARVHRVYRHGGLLTEAA